MRLESEDDKHVRLKEYLSKLHKQLLLEPEMATKTTKNLLASLQKMISMLDAVRGKLPLSGYDHIIASIEFARARRLLVITRPCYRTYHLLIDFNAEQAECSSNNSTAKIWRESATNNSSNNGVITSISAAAGAAGNAEGGTPVNILEEEQRS